jgi:hypothetical protein
MPNDFASNFRNVGVSDAARDSAVLDAAQQAQVNAEIAAGVRALHPRTRVTSDGDPLYHTPGPGRGNAVPVPVQRLATKEKGRTFGFRKHRMSVFASTWN